MSTAKLVFLDIETTHLNLEVAEPWEIALIVRDPKAEQRIPMTNDIEYLFQTMPERLELADPMALKVGRFTDRMIGMSAGVKAVRHASNGQAVNCPLSPMGSNYVNSSLKEVADQLFGLLDGAVLVGSNLGAFDIQVLRRFQARHGYPWTAYYHPIDVPDLVAGSLAAEAIREGEPEWMPQPPYRSSDLYRKLGVDISGTDARHTALGDARRERDVYDRVMTAGAP